MGLGNLLSSLLQGPLQNMLVQWGQNSGLATQLGAWLTSQGIDISRKIVEKRLDQVLNILGTFGAEALGQLADQSAEQLEPAMNRALEYFSRENLAQMGGAVRQQLGDIPNPLKQFQDAELGALYLDFVRRKHTSE
jgi:hypothetical protein